ncbi:unnamed protein product [Blepharisma stoltei]|uniref:Uncharacterized protein n=1 Tax=Blepharisma stoltei TaxID=1481888 RepID=A0AAU9K4G1_9CILI|nr:unnamed protein product [Blepharisma stoltei]
MEEQLEFDEEITETHLKKFKACSTNFVGSRGKFNNFLSNIVFEEEPSAPWRPPQPTPLDNSKSKIQGSLFHQSNNGTKSLFKIEIPQNNSLSDGKNLKIESKSLTTRSESNREYENAAKNITKRYAFPKESGINEKISKNPFTELNSKKKEALIDNKKETGLIKKLGDIDKAAKLQKTQENSWQKAYLENPISKNKNKNENGGPKISHRSHNSDSDVLAKIFKSIDSMKSSEFSIQKPIFNQQAILPFEPFSSPKTILIPGIKTHEKSKLDIKAQEALLSRLYQTPRNCRSEMTSPTLTSSSRATPKRSLTNNNSPEVARTKIKDDGHRSPIKLRNNHKSSGSLTDRAARPHLESKMSKAPRVKQKYLDLKNK